MYYSILGKILKIKDDFIVLENNNIGYKIYISKKENLRENEEKLLFLYQSVKENSIELYGFESEDELIFFELLINVSGVGPKLAMIILSFLNPINLKKIILNENVSELISVPGIGSKVAKKIILELNSKVEKINLNNETKENDFDNELYETLIALGFNSFEIREAIKKIPHNSKDKLREALKFLGKN